MVTAHFWTLNPDGSAVFGDISYSLCTDGACHEQHLTQLARRAIRNWIDIEEVLNIWSTTGSVS